MVECHVYHMSTIYNYNQRFVVFIPLESMCDVNENLKGASL